jgi:ubiquinone/menaquinone biosynthesis C-methylase UbiE
MPTTMRRLRPGDGDRVLDAGAGTGRLTLELARTCKEVIAVDYSLESLKLCREKCERSDTQRVFCVQADLCKLPFKSGVFDKAGSVQVIQDLPSADGRTEMLRELHRVLRRDGMAVLTTFNYPFPERLGFVKYAGKKEGYHHTGGSIYYYRFDYKEFKNFLSSCFRIVELCGIRNIPAKPFGEWMRRMGLLNLAAAVDFMIEKTFISRLTGRFLLAKLVKP